MLNKQYFYAMRTLLLFTLVLLSSIPAIMAQNTLTHQHFSVAVRYLKGEEEVTMRSKDQNYTENNEMSLNIGTIPTPSGQKLIITLRPYFNIQVLDVSITFDWQPDSVERVFVNGYQCWTNSQEFEKDDKLTSLSWLGRGFAQHYGDYNFLGYKPAKGIQHGWTYAYTRLLNGQMHFYASLDESEGYTQWRFDSNLGKLTMTKQLDGKLLLQNQNYEYISLLELQGEDNAVFDVYAKQQLEATTETMRRSINREPSSTATAQTGWTSWYNYYTKIDEGIILENLKAFSSRNIPIGMFQIDDGYQKSVGDWTTTNAKFPNGMKHIADSIHAAGYKAGLWLAPFICEKNSDIYRNHFDWIVKDDKGKPITAGVNPGWSGKYFALDIYHTEVQNYLRGVFDTVLNVWGYDMVKLDFLFAASIRPQYRKSRGEMMTDGMIMLRNWVGDKWILGCGVPLGPSMNVVDYCRVSSDVHMKWEMKILKALHARERLSVWNTLTTNIARRHLGGRFIYNDPDVYVLRDENNKLTAAQKHTMFFVNNLFGQLVFTSDNINNYSVETMGQYLSGFPLLPKREMAVTKRGDAYEVTFAIGKRHYLAYINLSSKKQTWTLPAGEYFDPNTGQILSASEVTAAPYTSFCYYKLEGKGFQLLGGKGHLFPGSEVKDFLLTSEKNANIFYHTGANQKEAIYILLPPGFKGLNVNNQPVETVQQNGYTLAVYRP
jgi:alpha-galactosidase